MKRILLLILLMAFVININAKTPPKGKYAIPTYLKADFDDNNFDTDKILGYINKNRSAKFVNTNIISKKYPSLLNKDLTGSFINQSGIEVVNIVQAATPGDFLHQSETWISINPMNPNNVIATCNFFGGGNRMYAYYTFDGGKTWGRSATADHSSLFNGSKTIFDPTIGFNSYGEALYVYGLTSNDENRTYGGIYMSSSYDGGKTWRNFLDPDDPIGVVKYADNSPTVFQDRYSTVIDAYSINEELKDNVYVAWQRFADFGSGIHVAAAGRYDEYYESSNRKVSPDGTGTQGGVPATGPDGELYVTWRQMEGLANVSCPVRFSSDGGLTYSKKSTMFSVYNLGVRHPLGSRRILTNKDDMRISASPIITVDNTPVGSKSRGNVYGIIAGKLSNGDIAPSKLHFAKSTDQAETWEVKFIDNATNGADIFLPNIDVDDATGYIHIFYYSSEHDNENVEVHAYYAISKDEGATFKHIRLTDSPFKIKAIAQDAPDNRYWGDYTGITAYKNKIYPLFWLPTTTNFSFGSIDLFSALITTAPLPPFPIENEVAEEIIINWSNIIYDGVGDIVDDFTVELWKNDVLYKTFEKNVTSYIDSDFEIGDDITYKIRTVSNDVRGESEFYSFDVKAGGSIEPMPITDLASSPSDDGLMLSWVNPITTVNGIDFTYFDRAKIFIGENLVAEVSESELENDNGTLSYNLITDELGLFYEEISVVIVAKRNDEEVESQNNPSLEYAYAGPVSNGYANSFEDDFNTYAMFKFGENQWQTTDAKAAEGTYSLTDSEPGVNYSPELNDGFILAPFRLDGDNLYLHWKYIAIVHKGDYASISVSNDNGKTWLGANWMNATASELFEGDLAGAEWIETGINLPDLGYKSGDIVYIKIKLVTNNGINKDGIYLDDFLIDNNLSINTNSINNINVTPNPIKEKATISFDILNAGDTRFEIYNLIGNRLLDFGSQFYTTGLKSKDFNLSILINGVYYLRISQNNSYQTIPLVIEK